MAAIEHFEKSQKHMVGMHTFSKLSQVQDPAFLEDLLTVMTAERPSMGKFANTVANCAKKQWCCWHVHCPDLPVHAERRMCLLPPSSYTANTTHRQ
jgi:hypothetical protein